jgi:GNAT superfamily N-acetyltransferase
LEERYRFESLGEQHLGLQATFSCGEDALERYLRERAWREMEQRLAVVRVLYDGKGNRLAGYYTMSAVTIERGDLPSAFTHRVARYRVYPATLIGRLAVDREYQGQRLGGRLLLDALARAFDASRRVASFAIITDAKDENAQFFYQHYGFQLLPTERHDRRLFLPRGTVERLFTR